MIRNAIEVAAVVVGFAYASVQQLRLTKALESTVTRMLHYRLL